MISQEEKIESSQPLNLEARRSFLKLSLAERRRRLAAQAEQMAKHYEQEPAREERAEWQGGDIVEY
jgi:hypothetical protein